MKTININEESLREIVKKELIKAQDFEWTGWRIPLYLDEETGKVSAGGWLSNNSWQPDAHELPKFVETWNMTDLGYYNDEAEKEIFTDEDVSYEVEQMVENYIKLLKDHQGENNSPEGFCYELV